MNESRTQDRNQDPTAPQDSLGTLTTNVVGIRRGLNVPDAGPTLRLTREPDNRRDPNAIRVETAQGERVGYLPRADAAFLAPLIEAHVIELHIEAAQRRPWRPRRHGRGVSLRLHVCRGPNADELFRVPEPGDSPAALVHRLMLHAWETAGSPEGSDSLSSAIRAAAERLGNDASPATRLLARLLSARIRREPHRSGTPVANPQDLRRRAERLLEQWRRLRPGSPITRGRVHFVPVLGPGRAPIRVELIDEAVRRKHTTIVELETGPTVNRVRVRNTGPHPMLGPQGWLLLGAMQDRVLAASVVLKPGEEAPVAVCCVEQGRWRRANATFSSQRSAPPSVRRRPLRNVLREGEHGAEMAQASVWRAVAELLAEAKVQTETGSLSAAFEKLKPHLDDDRSALQFPPETCGIVVFAGERLVGMDVFADADTFRRAAPSLLDGYLLDARRRPRRRSPSSPTQSEQHSAASNDFDYREAARRLLDGFASTLTRKETGGEVAAVTWDDRTVSVTFPDASAAGTVAATGVVLDDCLLHFTAFPENDEADAMS